MASSGDDRHDHQVSESKTRTWFKVFINDQYTREAVKMTDDSFEYFASAIADLLDDMYTTYGGSYTKFLVYYDGRHSCRVGQALLLYTAEHPEWEIRKVRPPYHLYRSAGYSSAKKTTERILPNVILVIRDDRYEQPAVESFISFAVQHKVMNLNTCFRVQILLPQLQSQSFLL